MDWETLLCNERPRKSTNPGDHRVEFERDFDRSVFSTPVKRLQDKAQVFPLEPMDAIRTRLTHSLEVSSVARGLATVAAQWLLNEKLIEPGMDRSIEAIAATAGLIHDLGNPPFGHAGEEAIRDWFKNHISKEDLVHKFDGHEQCAEDFYNFEGNAQSLRLVTKLQILADFNGLNLTFGTLSASCKYTASSVEVKKDGNHSRSKPGYFASEQNVIDRIRQATGTGQSRNPITFLVEAADDIVYSVADIEDGIKKGILTWNELRHELEAVDAEEIRRSLDGMERILKAGANTIPPGLPDDTYASAFRTASIGVMVPSVTEEFKNRYSSIMDGSYGGELVADCDSAMLTKTLKSIGTKRVYCTPATLKLELMGRRVIGDLMTMFWEGAEGLPVDAAPKTKSFPGKLGALLSENYRRVFQRSVIEESHIPEAYHRYHLVTDYVCGMTDTFAKRVHSELTNGS